MARRIVQASAPNSRLWELEKIHGLINKKELELVEGIVVPQEKVKESLSANVFESMKKLGVLDCYERFTSCEPTFLPDELRWFSWSYYPFSSLPIAHMSKLVGLQMKDGNIKYLWEGKNIYGSWKPFYYLGSQVSWYKNPNLKFIQLKGCSFLERFPDVSGTPNIDILDLSYCHNLVEVDESVWCLKKLRDLNMSCCYQIKCLPSMLHTESLETLDLSSCWSLKRIPEFSPCMVNLSYISISDCSEIEELSSSIKYLSKLSILNLDGCTSLQNIPDSICTLKCLKTLFLFGCTNLQKLPGDLQSMESLEVLGLNSAIHFHALRKSCYLRELHLRGDLGCCDFPACLHGLCFLEELHIENNSQLTHLPKSISHLFRLKHLMISGCDRLQTLLGLPPGIQELTVTLCDSLEKIEDLSEKYDLNKIEISYCSRTMDKLKVKIA